MKTFIRTFNLLNNNIHDLELNGGDDDIRVVLFAVRRALAVNGFVVIFSQNSQINVAIQNAFINGYIGALNNAKNATAFTSLFYKNKWCVTKIYSKTFASQKNSWNQIQVALVDLQHQADCCINRACFQKNKFVIKV